MRLDHVFQVILLLQYSLRIWIDSLEIFKQSRVRLDSITDRINIFVYQKPSIWDLLKVYKWHNLSIEYLFFGIQNQTLNMGDGLQFAHGTQFRFRIKQSRSRCHVLLYGIL